MMHKIFKTLLAAVVATMKKKIYVGIVLFSFLLFFLRGVYAAPPAGADEILVGVTGYGDSPERYELMTNGQCNLWVQWGNPKNLMPEKTRGACPPLASLKSLFNNSQRVFKFLLLLNGAERKTQE